jgi:hypothetical protein
MKVAISSQANSESFSARLRTELQLILYRDGSSARNEGGTKIQRERFKRYLFTLHTIIRASVPLMKAAESCCAPATDPLLAGLAKYYHLHSIEENGHDRWLLADLEAIGVQASEVLSRRPSESVSELVGSQYYWIYHLHPVCLLGYIAVLEGYPPQKEDLEKLKRETGYPRTAFRTLAKHSYLDKHHGRALDDLLDSLPLNDTHRQWITLDAIYTAGKLTEIFSPL